MSSFYTDASLSGPSYGVTQPRVSTALPRVGRTFTDITSSGPGYGVKPPAAGAASPTGTGSSYYQSLLANDPLLASQLAGVNAQGTAAQGLRDTTRSGLLAQYGAIPQNVGFDPSQEARDLANQATVGGVSTVARENAAYGQSNANDAAAAAAHGLGHSGFVGQYMQNNLNAHTQNAYDNLNALLGNLGTANQNYLTTQGALQGQAADLANQAFTRLAAGINAGSLSSPTPPAKAGAPKAAAPTKPYVATNQLSALPSGTRGAGQLG